MYDPSECLSMRGKGPVDLFLHSNEQILYEERRILVNTKKRGVMSIIRGFVDRIFKDHVGAYAAQAAYFLIMSFIPFILFLTTLIRYTSVSYNMIRESIAQVFPQSLQKFVVEIVADVYMRSSAVLPITALTAIWSAGKGLQAITNGLNTIYHVKETRNWLITRIYAVFYTLLFSIALIMTLTLMVLGEKLHDLAMEYSSFMNKYLNNVIVERELITFVSLVVVFIVLFRVLPNRKATFRSQVPGALITAVAWMSFSYVFSFYLEMFPGFTSMYGNMATLIIAMLWLYIMMNLMLFGAEINIYFEKEFRRLAAVLREKQAIREEQKEQKRKRKEQERRKKRRISEGKKREEEFELYQEYLETEEIDRKEKEPR